MSHSATKATSRRIQQQRALALAQLARQRRRQRLAIAACVLAVVGVVGAMIGIAATSQSSSSSTSGTAPAAASLVNAVAHPSDAAVNGVGTDAVTVWPRAVSDTPLTSGGKPLVLYIGAEYCPYCAAERWPMVQALSRFGTFSGLRTARSGANDVYPNTPTFSFHGATYHSDYIAFDARELYTSEQRNGHYVRLDTMTSEQSKLLSRYGDGFPFLDLGGRFVQPGVSFKPDVLHEMAWEDIAASLSDPQQPVARAVDGTANVLTAAICELTAGQPSNVCTAAPVASARAKLRG